VPFTPVADHDALSSFFKQSSLLVAGVPDNATVTNKWGELQISIGSGINAVTIPSSDLNGAWGIRISGPADATFI